MEFLQVCFRKEDIRTFFRVTTHTPNPLFLWVVLANMQVNSYGQHNHPREADISQENVLSPLSRRTSQGLGYEEERYAQL